MKLFYVPLEPLNARYTEQLCKTWFPKAVLDVRGSVGELVVVPTPPASQEISVGKVLDAVNRSVVSLHQASALVKAAEDMADDDVVYFQDFWTPGIEALMYTLHLLKRRPRIYARCFAQSVDEYDFTHEMRSWMQPVEVGWSRQMAGVFVASTLHRDLMRAAGFQCPIHVTGLPFDSGEVNRRMDRSVAKEQTVVYTSRLNGEKNPWFMLDVARECLARNPGWNWLVTTSAKKFSSELSGLLSECGRTVRETRGRFSMVSGLSKDDYYRTLSAASVQFNCALQDWVSFTMLEASVARCELAYPNFRAFPECVPAGSLYAAFDEDDAVRVVEDAMDTAATEDTDRRPNRAIRVCHDGLRIEVAIMLGAYAGPDVNVWHQPASFFAHEIFPRVQ